MVGERVRVLRDSDVSAVVALSLRAWEPVFAFFERQLGRRLFARLYPDWHAQQEVSVRQALADYETWVSAEADRVTGSST